MAVFFGLLILSTNFKINKDMNNYTNYGGIWFPNDTPQKVVNIVLPLIGKKDERLTFEWGDTRTGKSWGDKNSGYIGRSRGTKPIPIIVHNSRSMGGEAFLSSIVRVSTAKGNKTLWQHEFYHGYSCNKCFYGGTPCSIHSKKD
jgi:hypothetical protein